MRYAMNMHRYLRILKRPLRRFTQHRRMHTLERHWHETTGVHDTLFVLRTQHRYRDHLAHDLTPPLLPARRDIPAIAPEAWEALYKPRHHLNPEPVVDIILPVTDAYETTIPTLYRALTAPNDTPFRVVLVTSRHPDHKLIAKLRRLQELDLFDLLQDSGNEGLVTLTNFALQRHDTRDIVLLASNAELPDHWLDRLRERACMPYGSIASTSPWVSSGGVTGYPDSTGQLATVLNDTPRIDALCHAMFDDGIAHTLPAPSPHLTYIPRHAIGIVGPLPEQPKILAESLALWAKTADEKGFEHHFAPRLFVGAYGTPTDKSPEDSTLDPLRRALDQSRLRGLVAEPTLVIDGISGLHSTHHGALHLSADSENPSLLRLGLPDPRLFPHIAYALDDPAQPFIAFAESLGLKRILIRQLAGFPSRILEYSLMLADRLDATLELDISDDYLICPGLLGSEKTCAAEDLESGYASFLATHPLDADGQPLWLWRLRASLLLGRAHSIRFATPELEALYQRYYNIN